jgi:hypothetical protein
MTHDLMHHAALGDPLSLSAAFVVGMAGSVHCLAMCGGISGALGMRARSAATPQRAATLTACYQVGRLTSYTLAGAVVGASGGPLQACPISDQCADRPHPGRPGVGLRNGGVQMAPPRGPERWVPPGAMAPLADHSAKGVAGSPLGMPGLLLRFHLFHAVIRGTEGGARSLPPLLFF